jgi:primary-amine oxidase
VQHPLDDLTAAEYEETLAILQSDGLVDADSRYPFVRLQPLAKETVLAWEPGQPFERSAFVMAKQGLAMHEAVVNLSQGAVTGWEAIADVPSGILLSEWIRAGDITRADAAWQEAVGKRGIEPADYEQMICAPLSAGYFALPEEEGRRLFKVNCFDGRDTENFWGRPVEGITAVVDVEAGEVIKLVDSGVRPIFSLVTVWRHYDALLDRSASRRDRELVVRFITAIGN